MLRAFFSLLLEAVNEGAASHVLLEHLTDSHGVVTEFLD